MPRRPTIWPVVGKSGPGIRSISPSSSSSCGVFRGSPSSVSAGVSDGGASNRS